MAERNDNRITCIIKGSLLLEVITENDGIVDGQRQLQYDSYRVRNERNGSHHVVRSFIDQCCSTESKKKYRHFAKSLRGQDQHQNYDSRHDKDDKLHLLLDSFCLHITKCCRDMKIIGTK